MEELKKILLELISVVDSVKLKVKPDMLFEQAIKLYITQRIQKNSSQPTTDPNKPTEKQTAFLNKVNKYRDNLTRDEASRIIKEHIEANQKKD